MHFEGNLLNAVGAHELDFLLPVRNQNLVPLILENLGIIVRPGAGDPVGGLVVLAAAGAAGEGYHGVHMHFLGEHDGVFKVLMELPGDFLVGMHGVAMGGQRRDFEVVFLQGREHFVDLLGMCEEFPGVTVRLAGEADFHGLHAQTGKILAGVLKGSVLQKNRKYAEFHRFSPPE